MATVPKQIDYPTSDGKPMAETGIHLEAMIDLIHGLEDHYRDDPRAYARGNMLMLYEEGNRRRHVSPDVFVVLGVEKRVRPNYLIWAEGKGPDLVIELTSKSTRKEDVETKFALYRDVLGVEEYILFDPLGDYLKPPLRGYRLDGGEYRPIEPVDGRLPSRVTGLHFEAAGRRLRLFDPARGGWLATRLERLDRDEAERHVLTEARLAAEAARLAAEDENRRLREEIEALRRSVGGAPAAG